MAIITISRGTFSGCKELAEKLAQKLGYLCLSREQLSEEAIQAGVPVGKLQTAMLKPPRVYTRLSLEREHYVSCITSILCKYALSDNLIYYGHTGHLLLPGIPNIFRVRVLADSEYRISAVMNQLKITREKALQYVADVDRDRDKWVRFLHGVDWHDPMNYDLVVNLSQMGVNNVSTAMCSMAALPDFVLTPASIKALQNLYLANRARFLLARDHRTGAAEVKVTAEDGIVQVTYLPQDAESARHVPEILKGLAECREVHTTIARSNILWLGDCFDPSTEVFNNMVKVAAKWDAAVEIMRMAPEADKEKERETVRAQPTVMADKSSAAYDGGIEDDREENECEDMTGVEPALDALATCKCFGGSSVIYGDKATLITALGHRMRYSLVVIGNVYSSRPASVRKRLTSELRSLLSDNIKAPVIGAEDLKQQLQFKLKDGLRLALYLAVAVTAFILVFTHQEAIMTFLAGEAYQSYRVLAIVGILLFASGFAYLYGTFARQILKIFRFE